MTMGADGPIHFTPLRAKSLPSPTGVALIFDVDLSARKSQIPDTPFLDSPAGPSDITNPQLISENWLHSKEP